MRWINSKWGADKQQLASLYQRVRSEVDQEKRLSDVINTEDKGSDLNDLVVTESQYSQQLRKKQNRQAIGTTFNDATLSPEQQLYDTLSVDAGYDKLSESYFDRCSGKSDNALVELSRKNIQKYKEGAFQQISVFKGCELNPKANSGSPGSIQEVAQNVEKSSQSKS